MTKFSKLHEPVNKTRFEKELTKYGVIENTTANPYDYDDVCYLGETQNFGSMFKAWSYKDPYFAFAIYFGTKGDEFK